MQKCVPVQWFLDTGTMLKRTHSSYSEEFHILNSEVPAVDMVPADEVKVVLDSLKQLGGHEELIYYLEFLLKET